jgi:flagellar M-ring protein FliF
LLKVPFALNALLNALNQRLQSLTMGQRVVIGTLLMGSIMAAFLLYQRVSDTYDVLYSNLSLPDAAATVNKLKEGNTPYRLADGGTTILVPRDKKNELTLETASELTSSEGVSLAKIPPVLQGEVQKEWIKKFNTDQVAATLQSIQGIRHAKVMIATPEETVFSENEDPIRASVMLVVDPGFRLKEKQVGTIRNLVSHAVPGLKPEHVVISDNFGNMLDDSPASPTAMQTRESRITALETTLQKKVLGLLEPVAGEGNAVVSVSVDLNFDQARAQVKTITPAVSDVKQATGVVVSQQTEQEQYEGAKRSESGPAGIESNAAPSYQSQDSKNGNDKKYSSSKQTTNYAHSEENKEIVYASGGVNRVTVAVVLNKVLTQAETAELQEMIANAAGLNFDRGDSVDVKGFTFTDAPNKKQAEMAAAFKASQQQEFYLQLGYVATLLILGVMALVVLRKVFEKPIAITQPQLLLDSEGRPLPDKLYTEDGDEITQDMLIEQKTGKVLPLPAPVYDSGGKLIRLGDFTRDDLRLPENTLPTGSNQAEIEYMRQSIYGFIQQDAEAAARILMAYMANDPGTATTTSRGR